MIVGVPTEVKTREYRVGMIPAGARMLTSRGHKVLVQQGAGLGSGIADETYKTAGAEIVGGADEVWKRADMIFKVKEPLPEEYPRMREGQILYTYLHLAAAPQLAAELVKRGVTGVAYETIELDDGRLPLLQPMSAVAGRMAIQVAATYLEKEKGGKGILLGGVPGVRRGRVAIIGGGIVGQHAARMAIGLGAMVNILDINPDTLAYVDDIYQGRVNTLYSDPLSIEESVIRADVVVGAVLVTGAKAPRLVTEDMIKRMEPGSVIVDVAVDQGGCIETCHPTTHDDPTFTVHGVIHYCVANMPGAVARTSTFALNNATLAYGVRIADQGIVAAASADRHLAKGINTYKGKITHKAVAAAVNADFVPFANL
ncbi:MAG: alanine dehydrogenase [Myxococcales bacterium]|nr:alanine dehydrogenase [Myxococcales bacterium]